MSDPVDTDALRAVAHEADQDQFYRWAKVISAAADEVDRLRVSDSNATQQRDQLANALRRSDNDNDRLRAVIENAPHDKSCMRAWEAGRVADIGCTCWKAKALG